MSSENDVEIVKLLLSNPNIDVNKGVSIKFTNIISSKESLLKEIFYLI